MALFLDVYFYKAVSFMLTLSGNSALSLFRQEKLQRLLNEKLGKTVHLSANYMHFVDSQQPLSQDELAVLDALLHYGPAHASAPESEQQGELFLVLPRLGTISPWSSKATDIAHNCNLNTIARIERGIAVYIDVDGAAISAADKQLILPEIHDRMVEMVVTQPEQAEALFTVGEPKPLAAVDILAEGRSALESANISLGLALAADEIDYCLRVFPS
jgi:phosphoribosylformylglycinamidine synthase